MADIFPQTLEIHESPNLRLGIKSSLNSLKPLVASLYIIYKASEGAKQVYYSEEKITEYTSIVLSSALKAQVETIFSSIPNVSNLVANSQLFLAQIEALQVGIELIFHLGKIDFIEPHQERTGNNRYQKYICFSEKMMVLDLFLSAYSNKEEVNTLLNNWLQNKAVGSAMELSLKKLLTTFTEDSYYKIKKMDGSEIVFNPESIYKTLLASGDVQIKDGDQETVGPLRILSNYISEDLHPAIKKSRSSLSVKDDMRDWLESYTNMVATSLDLIPRQLPIDNNNSNRTANNKQGIIQDSSAILQYLTAIRTKPFLLLAGISGTGKSRIVRKLAQATDDIDVFEREEDRWACHKPANFELIQVKPNWHNSMDVVGYKSNIGGEHYEFTPFVEFVAKAWLHPETPFFLCLDEMNLAPVEEYFAEYLSAIESRTFENGVYETDPIIKPFDDFGVALSTKMISHLLGAKADDTLETRFRKKGLTLPKNLIVMGTVNMDDTTFSFSRKVLDRAMSIEMNEVDYSAFLDGTSENDVPVLVEDNALLIDRPIKGQMVKDEIEAEKVIEYLTDVNLVLDGTPFKLGYRAANEAILFAAAAKAWGNDSLADALDQFTLMKILSRIEGDKSKLMKDADKTVLECLSEVINKHLKASVLDEETSTEETASQAKLKSIKKVEEMKAVLERDHFVSYWS